MNDTLINRLFDRAYGPYDVANNIRPVIDQDIAGALAMVRRLRRALLICQDQFQGFADEHRAKVGSYATLVENQELERLIRRDQGVADSIKTILAEHDVPRESRWLPIATAPQNGTRIRVVGRKTSGAIYLETTYWDNIRWEIEGLREYGPPTHWQPLEDLPDGY